jgi:transposase-like protein
MTRMTSECIEQIKEHFSAFTDDFCIRHVLTSRWPTGMRCPQCGKESPRFLENQKAWECNGGHSRARFSLRIGTVMEGSYVSVKKWLILISLLRDRRRTSTRDLAKILEVNQKTAWFMMDRFREAEIESRLWVPPSLPASPE